MVRAACRVGGGRGMKDQVVAVDSSGAAARGMKSSEGGGRGDGGFRWGRGAVSRNHGGFPAPLSCFDWMSAFRSAVERSGPSDREKDRYYEPVQGGAVGPARVGTRAPALAVAPRPGIGRALCGPRSVRLGSGDPR
jgi:hypothetical protein